jgi:tetratricopeptide (TPR) repeat protein
MKKIILAIAAMVVSVGIASAQDMAQATELYNNGATAISMENWTEALDYFQKALEMGKTIGDEAQELVANCKKAIPGVSLQIAKDLIKAEKYDEAAGKLEAAAKIAEEFENAEVAEEAKDLVPKMWMQKGADALKLKDFATAADGFAKSYAIDTTAGKTALYLGQALGQLGKTDEAVEAFKHAAWNGEEEAAKGQISNLYVKEANTAFKAQKFADAVKAADKANSFAENATAYLIAGQASQKLSKNNDAIKNFEKYLELKPNASNANGIIFTVGALYQGQKNNAKALEFYKKVQNDAKYGAQAKQMIAALSK